MLRALHLILRALILTLTLTPNLTPGSEAGSRDHSTSPSSFEGEGSPRCKKCSKKTKEDRQVAEKEV